MREGTHIGRGFSTWLALAILAAIGIVLGPDSASAKVDVDKLTIGGEIRIRYEYRNNTSFNSNNTNESAASHRVRLNVGYDLTPDVSFFAQLQDARIWGTEGNGLTGGPAGSGIGAVSSGNLGGTGVDLHQGYILVKNILLEGLSLKAGRQEIIFGDQRLIGNFGWSQIGNSFDAVRLTHSMPLGDVDLFWARISESEVGAGCGTAGTSSTTASCSGIIFPANGAKATTDQDLYGAYITLKAIPNWTVEPYYFLLKDSRPIATTAFTQAQASGQARSTLGGRINGKAAGLDATAEGAWQFGSASSNVAGTTANNLHINAWAGAARAGYTLDAVPMKPRLGVEVTYATGDGCVASGATACQAAGHFNTFDNLFPTNHFKFGALDLGSWRNMVAYSAVFDVKPTPASKFQVNVWLFRLANRHDNWYRAGQFVYGATGANNQAASLGRELDIHYFRTLKEKFKFEIGYGHFWAGDYISNAGKNGNTVNGATGQNGSGENWGYVMGSILF